VKLGRSLASGAALAATLFTSVGWRIGALRAESEDQAVQITRREDTSNTDVSRVGRPEATIRVNSDLVLIPVMVTDRNDQAIRGLEREHFRLWENKVEQSITHFACEDAPVSVIFALDVSGSMKLRLKLAVQAVDQFLRDANPEDEFALAAFSDKAGLLQPFTRNADELVNKLIFLQAKGRTALLDAVAISLAEMRNAKNTRKMILIVSDGGDNNSRINDREIKQRVREADVQIYSIGILNPSWLRGPMPEDMQGAALLNDLSRQTGGRMFDLRDAAELPDVAVKIGRALRTEYMLGFVPQANQHDGKYHRVQVKVQQPQGRPGVRVYFRAGYVAPSN
jgi:VWFA-related protein